MRVRRIFSGPWNVQKFIAFLFSSLYYPNNAQSRAGSPDLTKQLRGKRKDKEVHEMSYRKAFTFIGMFAILFPVFAGSVHAFNKDDYYKLMTTNSCQGCDLTRIDLTGADLINADLASFRELVE